MKPSIKNYFKTPSILMMSVEAIEVFQSAHIAYVKKETDETRDLMARSLKTVKELQAQLIAYDVSAERIRNGFIKQVTDLEDSIHELHKKGLYPDLYMDGDSHFMLMTAIIESLKFTLVSKAEVVPPIEISSTTRPWKDQGIIAFCHDVRNSLIDIKLDSLWDALQWYEKSKAILTYTFEILAITGNLGRH